MLGALRLAAVDVDRGAVQRSAMHAVCDATLEVLTALGDHRDDAVSDARLAPSVRPVRSIGDCDDLEGRSVV